MVIVLRIYRILTLLAFFSDIKPHISSIKERIAEMINSRTSLEELYQLRGLFISGCNYVTTDSKTPITDDIVDYFLQQVKSKIKRVAGSNAKSTA